MPKVDYKTDTRTAFSERLKMALAEAGHSPESPTQLARLFNDASPDSAVTVHAARKWLVGEAIPTHEKLKTLAGLLQTTPNYLMWGEDDPRTDTMIDPEDMRLLMKIRALPDDYKILALDFIDMLTNRRIKTKREATLLAA